MKKKLLSGNFYLLLVLYWIANLYLVISAFNAFLYALEYDYGAIAEIPRAEWFKKLFELGEWSGIHPYIIGLVLGILAIAVIAIYNHKLNLPVKILLGVNPFLTLFYFPADSVFVLIYCVIFLALPIAITVLAVRDRKRYAQL